MVFGMRYQITAFTLTLVVVTIGDASLTRQTTSAIVIRAPVSLTLCQESDCSPCYHSEGIRVHVSQNLLTT